MFLKEILFVGPSVVSGRGKFSGGTFLFEFNFVFVTHFLSYLVIFAASSVAHVLFVSFLGAVINQPGAQNESPLHIACRMGNVPMASLLLERNANPHVVNVSGLTPLHYACRRGSLDLVTLLLSRGAVVRPT